MRARWVFAAGAVGMLAAGCGEEPAAGDTGGVAGPSVALLGGGSHTPDSILVEVIADASDDLYTPRDLAFHPDNTDQLWVVNKATNSVTILKSATSSEANADHRDANDGTEDHFLAKPSALAFGNNGMMATAHEEDELTQGAGGTPEDFMGPTLWTSDPQEFEGGHTSHYDMLHNSPNGVGIAWEKKNVYWIYDGYHGSLTRYDFGGDHGAGGADHSDGIVRRYLDGEMGYKNNVGSHLVYDADAKLLYAADTKKNRVVALDTKSGQKGDLLTPNYDGTEQVAYDDADFWTLIEGSDHGLEEPSGLEMHDDLLFVGDHASGKIFAFDLQGQLVDWVDTGLGKGLMGMAFDEDGRLYAAHSKNDEVVRITGR